MNHKQSAKSFCVTNLPMLTDKQYERVVSALTTLLEYTYTIGKRDGVNANSERITKK